MSFPYTMLYRVTDKTGVKNVIAQEKIHNCYITGNSNSNLFREFPFTSNLFRPNTIQEQKRLFKISADVQNRNSYLDTDELTDNVR